jgi:hypothetical protein
VDGIKITNVVNKVLQLGDCEYESGSLAVPAVTEYKAGTLLKRGTGESFAIATDEDTAVAVIPFDIANTASVSKTTGIRALIWGRVRRDMLHYNAAPTVPLTPSQRDALRSYGIVARKVTDVSEPDNQ